MSFAHAYYTAEGAKGSPAPARSASIEHLALTRRLVHRR
jgi:hypothetical protein